MTASILLFLLSIVAYALADNSCSSDSLQNQHSVNTNDLLFSLYLKAYGKEYCDDQEYKQRQNYFEKSLSTIRALTKQHPNTKFGLNHMSDWSDAERRKLYGFKADNLTETERQFNLESYVPKGNAPVSWDWREKGCVTPVKDQHPCGSCFVFSAIGNIEGQYAKKYNKLLSLSEQQGLDCDSTGTCKYGGLPEHVYAALAQQGGSEREEDYPYKGVKGQCSTDPSKIVVKVTGGTILKITNEETLKDALYNLGPLSIAMDFTSVVLITYRGGIANPDDCYDGTTPNHALLLVGYGTENNVPYWIVKNSWATTWGENGYLRLIRGESMCGILEHITNFYNCLTCIYTYVIETYVIEKLFELVQKQIKKSQLYAFFLLVPDSEYVARSISNFNNIGRHLVTSLAVLVKCFHFHKIFIIS